MTLRRRSPKMVAEIAAEPISAWRQIEIEGVSRTYRTPRILDRRITLGDYQGPIRQLTITDLGHEEPTLLLTNQLTRSARDAADAASKALGEPALLTEFELTELYGTGKSKAKTAGEADPPGAEAPKTDAPAAAGDPSGTPTQQGRRHRRIAGSPPATARSAYPRHHTHQRNPFPAPA